MADATVNERVSAPIPRERGTAEFFTLNAKYSINPDSKTGDLGDDIGCLGDILEEVIQAIIDQGEHLKDDTIIKRGFAALYLCQQTAAVAREYVTRTAATAHADEGSAQ